MPPTTSPGVRNIPLPSLLQTPHLTGLGQFGVLPRYSNDYGITPVSPDYAAGLIPFTPGLPYPGVVSKASVMNQTSWTIVVSGSTDYFNFSFNKTVGTGEICAVNPWVGEDTCTGGSAYNRTDVLFGHDSRIPFGPLGSGGVPGIGVVSTIRFSDTVEVSYPAVGYPAVGVVCNIYVPHPDLYFHPEREAAFYNYGAWGEALFYHFPEDSGGEWGFERTLYAIATSHPASYRIYPTAPVRDFLAAADGNGDYSIGYTSADATFQGMDMGMVTGVTALESDAIGSVSLNVAITGTDVQWPDWTTPNS